ncbi:MAG: TadE/TadG family type IV pilus assembly protein [Candidatus Obscuribacterales bacterium]
MRILSRLKTRNPQGVVAAVFCCLILLIVITAACLGVDIAHNVHVQSKLQAATDAGALAGAVEIAKKQPNDSDKARAYSYAVAVTGSNEADNKYIKDEDPDTNVDVIVDADSDPKTVTVVASRRINLLFANMLRFGVASGRGVPSLEFRPDSLLVGTAYAGGDASNWLTTRSVGSPYLARTIYPHQVLGLIASIDCVPESGPAKGKKIADILQTDQPFDLVWNPQGSKNVGWVKAWLQDNDTPVTIGESWELQNGVANSALSSINVGDVIGMPLTQGGVPMEDSRPILDVITVEVVARSTNSMTVKVHEPIIFHGAKGVPQVQTSEENQAFLDRWQPWTVQLVE